MSGGSVVHVNFIPFGGAADVALLRSTLRVEHLQEYMDHIP